MIKTQYIKLNMTPSGVMPVLYCSQYDIGRPLGMVVYNDGESVDLDSYSCTIEATRTDGTAITTAVTTDDNIGAFVTTATMTNQADKYPAKLVLFDSNSRRVASLAFILCVTPKTMDENAESIEEDKSLYQQYTEAVQILITEIREGLTDLKNDEAMTGVHSVTPVYIGDFMTLREYLPSCCVKVGAKFYVFDPHTADYCKANNTDIGRVRVFDIANNIELTASAKDIHIGHANSCCYNPDTGLIYVVPADSYENHAAVPIAKLYAFPLDFSTMTVIDTPTLPKGVTYDFVKGKMYYCGRNQDVYEYTEGDEWEKTVDLDVNGVDVALRGDALYNQDFAVRDGYFFLSSPYGAVLFGKLEDGKVMKQYMANSIDHDAIFRLGELEGFEFDEAGHLFATMFTTMDQYRRNGFVVELPIGDTPCMVSSMGGVFSSDVRTVTLSSTTQNAFALDHGQIRSISQLSVMIDIDGSNVLIPPGDTVVDDAIVYIDQNLNITLRGELRVKQFYIYSGIFGIMAEDANNKLTCTGSETPLIRNLGRASEIKIGGQYALNVDLGNLPDSASNFINVGYSFPITTVRDAPVSAGTQKLRIGERLITGYTSYLGTKDMQRYDETTLTVKGCFEGYISSSGKVLTFTVYAPRPFLSGGHNVTVTAATGKIFARGIKGYIPDSNGILLQDEQIEYSISGNALTGNIRRETEWGNVTNNTPISFFTEYSIRFNLSVTT